MDLTSGHVRCGACGGYRSIGDHRLCANTEALNALTATMAAAMRSRWRMDGELPEKLDYIGFLDTHLKPYYQVTFGGMPAASALIAEAGDPGWIVEPAAFCAVNANAEQVDKKIFVPAFSSMVISHQPAGVAGYGLLNGTPSDPPLVIVVGKVEIVRRA
jgi:hypothetical protein